MEIRYYRLFKRLNACRNCPVICSKIRVGSNGVGRIYFVDKSVCADFANSYRLYKMVIVALNGNCAFGSVKGNTACFDSSNYGSRVKCACLFASCLPEIYSVICCFCGVACYSVFTVCSLVCADKCFVHAARCGLIIVP